MPRPMTTLALISGAALALAGCETVAEPAARAVGTTYRASLTGAAEVPTSGDPNGSGVANISLVDEVLDQVCYEITVAGIAPATAAHIHVGAAGEAGRPVVTLEAPTDGEVSGCVSASDGMLDAIKANPSGYYVNVHNAEYPGGAIRGQLRR
jgi:hypothetical protein